VLGEHGFSEFFGPATRDRFLHAGYYGIGPGQHGPEPEGAAARRLAGRIEGIVRDPGARAVGAESRALVVDRYSLAVVAERLEGIYREVAPPVRRRRAVVHGIRHTPTTVLTQLPEGIKNNPGLRWAGRRVGFLGETPT
jgi:hypothetical protein